MEFLVGATYRNRRGEYEVLAKDGDTLSVLYADGTTAALSAQVQSRIAENLAAEDRERMPSNENHVNRSFFHTVGFLAAHTEMIECFAPPQAALGFCETYRRLTGRDAQGSACFYPHGRDTDKWGVELRITFAKPPDSVALEFGLSASAPARDPGRDDLVRINNNELVKRLFSLGFVLGHQQDADGIRSRIPLGFRGEFDEGFSV